MEINKDETKQYPSERILEMIGEELDTAYGRGYFRGCIETRNIFLDGTAKRPPDPDGTMKLTITIPKGYISAWTEDRFREPLRKLQLASNHSYLVGSYEGGLCEMLIKAFENAREE